MLKFFDTKLALNFLIIHKHIKIFILAVYCTAYLNLYLNEFFFLTLILKYYDIQKNYFNFVDIFK